MKDTGSGNWLGGGKRPASSWQLGRGEAEEVLAEARKALFVMVAFIAILWIIQIANWADHYQLTADYGIIPHDVARLPDIFTAPFLHFSWSHIEGNSGPLFIFGFLAAYRGVLKFLGVTLVVAITSGLGAWIFENPHSLGAGASGVVFGYFGYIIVRGIFDKHPLDLVVGLIMALCFAYQFTVLLPQQGIGWQDHIGGVVGGVLAGWIFREGWRKSADDRAASGGGRPTSGGPSTAVDTSSGHPRADLHKELKDMGL
ncbi:MAG TPA: rhomboid family intramembrane serine protease [Streptosporangiaceae bacterium]